MTEQLLTQRLEALENDYKVMLADEVEHIPYQHSPMGTCNAIFQEQMIKKMLPNFPHRIKEYDSLLNQYRGIRARHIVLEKQYS